MQKIPLQLVQHQRRKMGRGDDASAEQGNFSFTLGFRLQDDAGMRFDIGKLFIAHFHRLFKNPHAGSFRKAADVVDGLGDGVPGNAQFICNILYSHSFHGAILLAVSR